MDHASGMHCITVIIDSFHSQEGAGTEPKLKYNMRHIRSLPAAWLFECLNNHQLVEPFN